MQEIKGGSTWSWNDEVSSLFPANVDVVKVWPPLSWFPQISPSWCWLLAVSMMHGDGSKDYVLMLIAAPGHAFLEYMDSNFPDFDFGLVFTISHCLTLHCGATNKILSDIQTVFHYLDTASAGCWCSGKEMLCLAMSDVVMMTTFWG